MRLALLWLLCPFLWADATVAPVPSNLKPEGVPPLPAALAEKLARYGESRAATLLDWEPGSRAMLIGTRFGDVPQIHRVALPGGARTQLTFFPDRTAGAEYQPGNHGAFVFAKDIGGGEFYQLYRYDAGSGAITLLTDGKSRNTGMRWSRDGRSLAFSSTRRNGKDTDIWVMDPRNPASARLMLQVEGGGWTVDDWLPGGSRVLVSERRSINDSTLYLVDAATGRRERVTPEGEASYSAAQVTPDGKGVYLITDRDSEFERAAYFDLATRQLRFLTPDSGGEAEELRLSNDGRCLAYVVNQDGYSRLHLWDTAARRELASPALPAGVIGGLRWNDAGTELGFHLASARSPSDVYSYVPAQNKLERWTYSETGGLNAAAFPEPALIRWKSFDGRTISGLLYRPPARFTGPRPVIVNIHGGPEGQSRPGFLARNNYYLNELGIALIFPNVRGSTGYGKTYRNLDNALLREDSVKDIGALLDWAATDRGLDSSRIMVTGGSYGGYMTYAAMVHYNARFRCAVDVVGISNFLSFFERTSGYRKDLRRVEYGDERDPRIHAFFEEISPLKHAASITRPMFIVAGRNDPRVPWQEGRQMADAIHANGAPVWFLVAEDEGHGFARKGNQDYQFAATVLFVQQYLLR